MVGSREEIGDGLVHIALIYLSPLCYRSVGRVIGVWDVIWFRAFPVVGRW